MKKWRCKLCGYVYEGEEPPETCPPMRGAGIKVRAHRRRIASFAQKRGRVIGGSGDPSSLRPI